MVADGRPYPSFVLCYLFSARRYSSWSIALPTVLTSLSSSTILLTHRLTLISPSPHFFSLFRIIVYSPDSFFFFSLSYLPSLILILLLSSFSLYPSVCSLSSLSPLLSASSSSVSYPSFYSTLCFLVYFLA